MIKKRGKKALALKTIGRLILLILVLVLVMWFIFGDDLWSYVKNLPEYGGVNDSDIRLEPDNITEFECPILVAKLGKIDNRFEYLIRRVHKLNVHLGSNIGRYTGLSVDVSDKDNYKIFIDKFGPYNLDVGGVENNKLWIYDHLITNYNQKGEDYKLLRDTVKLDDLKRINGAYLADARTFCKTKTQFEDFDKKSQCLNSKLTCELFDGRCVDNLSPEEAEELNKILDPEDKFRDIVDNCGEGEISYGQLDCHLNEKSCCVKQVDSELSSQGIVIDGFSFVPVEDRAEALESGVPISLLDKTRLEVNRGERGWIYFSSKYNGETSDDAELPLVCYLIKTNKEVRHRGPFSGSFVPWTPTDGDRNLDLLVWIPWEDNKRAFKRIQVLPKERIDERYFDNDQFRAQSIVADEGDEFFIILENPLKFVHSDDLEERLIKEFRIRKVSGNRVAIDALHEGYWIELDCNWWGGWTTLKIGDLETSLSDTLELCEF